MAFPVRDGGRLVGRRVYEIYSPMKAGVITEVVKTAGSPKNYNGKIKPRIFAVVKVKWLNGKTTEVESNLLNDFDSLIEDHKSKLKTHKATLKKLMGLAT